MPDSKSSSGYELVVFDAKEPSTLKLPKPSKPEITPPTHGYELVTFGNSTAYQPPGRTPLPKEELPTTPMRPLDEQARTFRGLAGIESQHLKNPYAAWNKESNALGKYQFVWSWWGNKIQDFAKRPVTMKEFINDPDLQERYAAHYYNNVLIPEAQKLQKRHGDKLKAWGYEHPADAKALIHFLGYNDTVLWLRTGQLPERIAKNNVTVAKYLDTVRKYY
jgi:hypothetical protein